MKLKICLAIRQSLFGWPKATTCNILIVQLQCRLQLLKNKRDHAIKQLKGDVVCLLMGGHQQSAFARVEQLLKDQDILIAYDLLYTYCEFILSQIPYIRKHKDCPNDINEAVSSLIFAAARCADLPELQPLRRLFGERYGHQFAVAAVELFPGSLVNRQICEKLCTTTISEDDKLRFISDLARDYRLRLGPPKVEDDQRLPLQEVQGLHVKKKESVPRRDEEVGEREIQVIFSSINGANRNSTKLYGPFQHYGQKHRGHLRRDERGSTWKQLRENSCQCRAASDVTTSNLRDSNSQVIKPQPHVRSSVLDGMLSKHMEMDPEFEFTHVKDGYSMQTFVHGLKWSPQVQEGVVVNTDRGEEFCPEFKEDSEMGKNRVVKLASHELHHKESHLQPQEKGDRITKQMPLKIQNQKDVRKATRVSSNTPQSAHTGDCHLTMSMKDVEYALYYDEAEEDNSDMECSKCKWKLEEGLYIEIDLPSAKGRIFRRKRTQENGKVLSNGRRNSNNGNRTSSRRQRLNQEDTLYANRDFPCKMPISNAEDHECNFVDELVYDGKGSEDHPQLRHPCGSMKRHSMEHLDSTTESLMNQSSNGKPVGKVGTYFSEKNGTNLRSSHSHNGGKLIQTSKESLSGQQAGVEIPGKSKEDRSTLQPGEGASSKQLPQPPYMRANTLPNERSGCSPMVRQTVRSVSFQANDLRDSPSRTPHVHPKLPDYDDLAAKFKALKDERRKSNA
ncbi:uncharacterized protein LOC18431483 isoform X1 [Amborella trichopoda]|uniref:uncharacterized protein LOC18431483 isoform X1 n=1 Tax=Amborella trichopoda TaxID=13333 RepID=UPI0009BDB72A|nr:uncharacterized protein LOC18431483 isoform X1 [Amborella trichopoda]|eukprot:XP_020521146.1 uncharacterized protein LOC18431483 isoform X1 [Amborella trichopoda]